LFDKMMLFLFLLISIIAPFAGEGHAINALGSSAVAVGLIANIGFMLYNRLRMFSKNLFHGEIVKQLQLMYKPLLNAHIMLNMLGYFAGMTHGLLYVRHLEPISISLVFVMNVLMASGFLLRYTSARDVRIFNKLLHSQLILSVMLVMLVILHAMTAEE